MGLYSFFFIKVYVINLVFVTKFQIDVKEVWQNKA